MSNEQRATDTATAARAPPIERQLFRVGPSSRLPLITSGLRPQQLKIVVTLQLRVLDAAMTNVVSSARKRTQRPALRRVREMLHRRDLPELQLKRAYEMLEQLPLLERVLPLTVCATR